MSVFPAPEHPGFQPSSFRRPALLRRSSLAALMALALFPVLPQQSRAAGDAAGAAVASPASARAAILESYAAAARQEDPSFSGFSARRGRQFYLLSHQQPPPTEAPNCAACHTSDPTRPGQTRAGKEIEPMAVTVTPTRFTDAEKVEKWFSRNCSSVVGRPCTATEKGDFITWLIQP